MEKQEVVKRQLVIYCDWCERKIAESETKFKLGAMDFCSFCYSDIPAWGKTTLKDYMVDFLQDPSYEESYIYRSIRKTDGGLKVLSKGVWVMMTTEEDGPHMSKVSDVEKAKTVTENLFHENGADEHEFFVIDNETGKVFRIEFRLKSEMKEIQ